MRVAAHSERVRRVDVEHDNSFNGQAFFVPYAIALDAGASDELARTLPRRRFVFATEAAMARTHLSLRAVLKGLHACTVEVAVAGSEGALDGFLEGQNTEAGPTLYLVALA
jgi:hypothetical protein